MSDILKIENGEIVGNKELLIKHLRKAGVDVGIKLVNSKINRNSTAILREDK